MSVINNVAAFFVIAIWFVGAAVTLFWIINHALVLWATVYGRAKGVPLVLRAVREYKARQGDCDG